MAPVLATFYSRTLAILDPVTTSMDHVVEQRGANVLKANGTYFADEGGC